MRSKWVTILTGGLNFQVIHHLLPNVSQIYYLGLYDIVDNENMVKIIQKVVQL